MNTGWAYASRRVVRTRLLSTGHVSPTPPVASPEAEERRFTSLPMVPPTQLSFRPFSSFATSRSSNLLVSQTCNTAAVTGAHFPYSMHLHPRLAAALELHPVQSLSDRPVPVKPGQSNHTLGIAGAEVYSHRAKDDLPCICVAP